jgi:hypothetical protein
MTPETNEDFEDIVGALTSEQCEFLVVGAHALAAHGAPRATGDLDIFVRPTSENAARVFRALSRFGAPLAAHGIREADFARPGTIYQMGLPPRRIDVLTSLSGVSFEEAAAKVVRGSLGPHQVSCIGLEAMIRNKRASGRTKDIADAEVLEELRARSSTPSG